MENSARIAGYSVVLATLVGILWIILIVRDGVLFPHNRVRVKFPSVGTLMKDDLIKMQGVEVGRVEAIESAEGTAIATLELYHRLSLAKDSRFINYNYSMFGARMIILVPGHSREAMDQKEIQHGDFSSGVTESIHRVEALLKTVIEYRKLSSRLEKGTDSLPSLQHILAEQIYPALEQYNQFAHELQVLQTESESELERLTLAAGQINGFTRMLATNSDTMIIRANRTLEQLTLLTAQSTVVVHGLEKILLAAQDSTQGPGRILMQRELYDKTLSLTHSLQDILNLAKKDGLQNAIHFWRNVHLHQRKSTVP